MNRLEEIRVDTSNIERNLTNVIVQYNDKFISTGALNPGAMAEDCLRVIRELQADIDRLTAERDAALRRAEAAEADIKSMLMDTCDRSICVNMKCHLDQASCNPIWRGRELAGEGKP